MTRHIQIYSTLTFRRSCDLIMEEIVLKAITHKELSPQEKEQLDDWLKESQKNRMIFNQMKLALKYPDEERIRDMKANGLDRLKSEIGSKGARPIQINGKSSGASWVLKIAASIILLLTASLLIYQYQTDADQPMEQTAVRLIEKTSLPGQKITVTLSDGTIVKLNSDSRIIAPDRFAQDSRQVELIGEAFFDVNRDTARPFIIKTRDLEVEVLGTSFNIKSYQSDAFPAVAVKTGKVAVNKISQTEKVYLDPNEMTSLREDGILSKISIDNQDLVFGWTEQRLVFNETSLEEVFDQVQRWFGVEIVVEKEVINKRPYTANYSNPTLDEVLKSLTHLYQFEYQKDGKRILIR